MAHRKEFPPFLLFRRISRSLKAHTLQAILVRYFAHGLLFSTINTVFVLVWLFLMSRFVAVDAILGLIASLLILFLTLGWINSFLMKQIWKNPVKTHWKSRLMRGLVLTIVLLAVSFPSFIINSYTLSLSSMILFFIIYCFIDGFVAKAIGDVSLAPSSRDVMSLLFLVPAFLLLFVFVFYPVFQTVYQSFLAKGTGQFVGLQNYNYVLFEKISPLINLPNLPRINLIQLGQYPIYLPSLQLGQFPMGGMIHNIFWIGIHLPLVVFFGLGFAVLLRDVKGGTIIKSIVFLGVVIPMVVGGVLFRFIYDKDAGVVNAFLRLVGLGPFTMNFTQFPQTALISLILASVWIWTGFAMIIYSAGLEGIPIELYEAAKIDGASRWKTFWRITVPMLRSTTVVVITLTVLWELKIFDIVYVATLGGPGGASRVLAYDMYDQAFNFPPDFGAASAIAVLLTLLTFGFAAYMVSRMAKS
jgi:multiple sugar transport system permease protein